MTAPTYTWPKGPLRWTAVDGAECISVPFTWNLPAVMADLRQRKLGDQPRRIMLGGPAVDLMEAWVADQVRGRIGVHIGRRCGYSVGSVLHRIRPDATRTSLGCPNRCGFCAVPQLEGGFLPLDDWTVAPIICDNNFLACSEDHRLRVYHRLVEAGYEPGRIDFNQGLDARLFTELDADWMVYLKATVRFSCDGRGPRETIAVANAVKAYLRNGGARNRLYCYALIGWNSGPEEAWERCRWLESIGVKYVCPMWHHALDQFEANIVRPDQAALGWDAARRTEIMAYYYKHRTPGRGADEATPLFQEIDS
jgi:hypothetical protein